MYKRQVRQQLTLIDSWTFLHANLRCKNERVSFLARSSSLMSSVQGGSQGRTQDQHLSILVLCPGRMTFAETKFVFIGKLFFNQTSACAQQTMCLLGPNHDLHDLILRAAMFLILSVPTEFKRVSVTRAIFNCFPRVLCTKSSKGAKTLSDDMFHEVPKTCNNTHCVTGLLNQKSWPEIADQVTHQATFSRFCKGKVGPVFSTAVPAWRSRCFKAPPTVSKPPSASLAEQHEARGLLLPAVVDSLDRKKHSPVELTNCQERLKFDGNIWEYCTDWWFHASLELLDLFLNHPQKEAACGLVWCSLCPTPALWLSPEGQNKSYLKPPINIKPN